MTFKSYLCIFYHRYFTILVVSVSLPRYCILHGKQNSQFDSMLTMDVFCRLTENKTVKIALT